MKIAHTRKDGTPIDRSAKTPTATQRLVTIPQVTATLGPPERTIHDWIACGALAYIQFPHSRKIWIDRRDIEQLIATSKWRREDGRIVACRPADAMAAAT